jgi:hypothetical protein
LKYFNLDGQQTFLYSSYLTCGDCICNTFNCLYKASSRCEGKCDKMNCRGGIFRRTYKCEKYVRYENQQVKECLNAMTCVFQDGYILCSLIENFGCESCYKEFIKKEGDEI